MECKNEDCNKRIYLYTDRNDSSLCWYHRRRKGYKKVGRPKGTIKVKAFWLDQAERSPKKMLGYFEKT